ncbi:MAG: nucleotidyltransferase domain-containing protein [Nanoarchaeota archaeon]
MGKYKEIEEIKKKILPVLKEYEVTKAGIFGSYARSEQKNNSDIDILIKIDDKAGLIEIIRLKELLQKITKKKVDLVEYETIRKELREQILNDEVRILQ